MKTTLIILVLIFTLFGCEQGPLIEDYKIEGIGLGDSLLDFYSEDFILDNTKTYNQDGEFLYFESKKNLKTYSGIQILYKKDDKKYKVYTVVGMMNFNDRINECYNKQDEVLKELSDLLKIDQWEGSPWEDYEGSYDMHFTDLDTGENIQVFCSEWVEESNNFDNLRIVINSQESWTWINNQ